MQRTNAMSWRPTFLLWLSVEVLIDNPNEIKNIIKLILSLLHMYGGLTDVSNFEGVEGAS